MPSDVREQLKTIEEYKEGMTFTYNPIVNKITTKNKYDAKSVDVAKFTQIDIEKDSVRAELLTTEQTEKAAIKGKTSQRSFNVAVAGATMTLSFRSKNASMQGFHNKVMREYSKLFDTWGIGGQFGNNGLIISSDPNYVTNTSVEIPVPGTSDFDDVSAMSDLMTTLKLQVDANTASKNLLVYLYGSDLITKWNKITRENETVVSKLMKEKFADRTVEFVEIPSVVLPASVTGNGFVIVCADVASMDYCQIPDIESQGSNEEKQYFWANYIIGSLQINPEEYAGIIKQPVTFAAAAAGQ